jgi:hypothetical protein
VVVVRTKRVRMVAEGEEEIEVWCVAILPYFVESHKKLTIDLFW